MKPFSVRRVLDKIESHVKVLSALRRKFFIVWRNNRYNTNTNIELELRVNHTQYSICLILYYENKIQYV